MHILRIQLCALLLLAVSASAEPLATAPVKRSTSASSYTAEAVVEAIKTTQIAAETQGSITALPVKVGDSVKAGQVLARIDSRVARQQVTGSQAQAAAANAQLFAARQTYERKQRLYEKHYISQAALEQASAEYKTAQAQTHAQQAEISIANVQAGLHTVVAPYSGIISAVFAEVGDMALPGKPLLTLYDPQKMRVTASVPESQITQLDRAGELRLEISGHTLSAVVLSVQSMIILPTADAISHQIQVRITLPQNLTEGLTKPSPGTFARLSVPITGKRDTAQLQVPSAAVMRRGELSVLYVVINGSAQLRQVRLGQTRGDFIEIVSGVEAGEQVALNPLAAISSFKSKK